MNRPGSGGRSDSTEGWSYARQISLPLLDQHPPGDSGRFTTCPHTQNTESGNLPDEDALRLVAPARVQVNSLQACPGRCALTDALTGWTGEWLAEGTAASTESPKVWVLPGASARLGVTQPDGVTRLITALPSDQLIHG